MTKRQRDDTLTREDFEKQIAQEEGQERSESVTFGGSFKADVSVLQRRKIVKVKRHN